MLLTPVPSNFKNAGKAHYVESDLYSIALRVKELDPNLVIVFHEDHEQPFVVMEKCADGVERFVSRYTELDARIIEDLQYMLRVPFEHRLAEADKRVAAANAEVTAPDPEKQDWYFTEMARELRRSGLMTPHWGTNYPLVPGKRRRANG